MARRASTDERREQIAGAVLRIAARDGLDAASVRDVAAEAGVSAGMVQHHFRTRDGMLRFACEVMVDRMAHGAAGGVETDDPRGALRRMLTGMLPTDDARRTEVRVWVAFLARAVIEPELGAFMLDTHRRTYLTVAAHLSRARARGELRAGVDPDRAAVPLFAAVEGLVSHVLLGHFSPAQAETAIDDLLDALFRPAPGVA